MSIGSVFEGMIRYGFLGVTLALLPMLFLLLLLHARERIMEVVSGRSCQGGLSETV